MDKKNIFQKLKIGFFGISIILPFWFSCNNSLKLERYNTLAHKILMIEDSTDDIPFNTCPSVKTLDSLINNSGKYIEKKENYSKEELKKISKKIYSEISNLKGIKNREDFCYRSALIYSAIGEANKISFYIIDIPGSPGHTLIRYDSKNDGHDPLNPNSSINKRDINIETTTGEIQENQNGKYSDNYYINEFAITKNSLEKNVSLKSLNEKELLSLAYVQIAIKHIKKNTKNQENLLDHWRKKSIENCNKAIKLDPLSQSAYITLGIAESIDNIFPVSYEGHKKAIKYFEKALKINPSANTYYLIANSYRELSQREKAIENYTNSLNLIYELRKEFSKPADYLKNLEIKCLLWRAHIHEILGEDNQAEKDKKSSF